LGSDVAVVMSHYLVSLAKVVSRIFASWNQLERWFRDVDGLCRVA
jgi:hypothetical protein